MSDAIRLDPAVEAAKRIVALLPTLSLPKDANDDIITMAIVILRLAGYQIADQTGEGILNTTPQGLRRSGHDAARGLGEGEEMKRKTARERRLEAALREAITFGTQMIESCDDLYDMEDERDEYLGIVDNWRRVLKERIDPGRSPIRPARASSTRRRR